ncbi:dihydroorotate dehydrogenase electron transfer subunit [Halobacillus salinarum]|nr:dihydroorotate dehydrogenase electron transfer subunit [Halobacillus salinarum]
MQREWMRIVKHTEVARDTYQLILNGDVAQHVREPGQFVHVQVSQEYFLRRPVSIADVNQDESTITLLYKVMGKGTNALTGKKAGDFIDVLGPGGKGFPLHDLNTQQALLIGGGIGVPPLHYLGKKLKEKGVQVTSVLGFQTKEDAFYVEKFKELGKVFVTTNDGSLGTKGFVTNVLPDLKDRIDTFFSCGPTVMLRAVKEEMCDVPGYISIEERMGCGIGACFACVVESNDDQGYRKICCDGPVFRPDEVILP